MSRDTWDSRMGNGGVKFEFFNKSNKYFRENVYTMEAEVWIQLEISPV
jgi:hypothetical protein